MVQADYIVTAIMWNISQKAEDTWRSFGYQEGVGLTDIQNMVLLEGHASSFCQEVNSESE